MKYLVMAAALVAWTYVADNGVQAWTDDKEQIPVKYLHHANRVELGPLVDYPRLSIMDPIVVDSEDQED